MVVDSSAVIALLRGESEAPRLAAAMKRAGACVMTAVNAFECRTVLYGRFGPTAVAEFELLVQSRPIVIEAFDERQSLVAFEAYRRYGKGTGHRARLNMGDCAAYALAVSRGLPLLFVGDDFRHTDATPAL